MYSIDSNLFWLQAKNAFAVIRSTRQRYMRLLVVRPGEFPEIIFRNYLVEDKRVGGSCYAEFMCHLHEEINSQI